MVDWSLWTSRGRKFVVVSRTQGLRQAVAMAADTLRKRSEPSWPPQPSSGVPRQLQLLERFPLRDLAGNPEVRENLQIHWVVPDFSAGGGGHMTLFRAMYWLEYYGHENVVWVLDPTMHATPAEARDTCHRHYLPLKADFRFIKNDTLDASGDIIFATDCWSVWPVLSATKFKKRAYFVQDYESQFTSAGSLSVVADLTYDQDFVYVCAGQWLSSVLTDRGHAPTAFKLAVDDEVFHPQSERRSHRLGTANDPIRIAFYARSHTPRRAVELGWVALQHLASTTCHFVVHAFGQDVDPGRYPFPVVSHGILDTAGLAALYRSCDVGMCFSATNYSLVGQEMAATGLPVLELDSSHTRLCYDDGAVTFVKAHPKHIADAIAHMAEDGAARNEAGRRGLEAVAGLSWKDQFSKVAVRLVQEATPSGSSGGTRVQPVTVAIPTLNGGEQFMETLDAIAKQDYPGEVRLLVVDSGSTDGTLERAREYPNASVSQIDRSEFSHGGTRNRLMGLAETEKVVFLTQDAVPQGKYWLFNLCQTLDAFPDAAGAFGRHVPRVDADPFTKRDIEAHFDSFDALPTFLRLSSPQRLSSSVRWQQMLHYFSSNNSVLRKAAWQQVPFPEVNYGEDQLWAWAALQKGYGRVYAKHAPVAHSHNYTYEDTVHRARVESAYFRLNFGYHLIDKNSAEATLSALNEGDRRFASSHGIDEARLTERLRLNEATVAGRLQGVNDHRVMY